LVAARPAALDIQAHAVRAAVDEIAAIAQGVGAEALHAGLALAGAQNAKGVRAGHHAHHAGLLPRVQPERRIGIAPQNGRIAGGGAANDTIIIVTAAPDADIIGVPAVAPHAGRAARPQGARGGAGLAS